MEIDAIESAAVGYAFLCPADAERLVEDLADVLNVEDIGDKAWLERHQKLERLNFQAHHSAQKHADNFVVESLVTFAKIPSLIQSLLVMEVWKDNVFPLFSEDHLSGCSTRIYFILFHEATLANLLEVAFFYEHVVESAGDLIVELVDYCVRKIRWLVSLSKQFKEDMHKGGKELVDEIAVSSAKDDLTRQNQQICFQVAVVAVSILRFLVEHSTVLPLSAVTRLIDTHDIVVALVPLIESPPWTYRNRDGVWRKFVDQKWIIVSPEDLLNVTKTEAQVWIALYYLLCKTEFRHRYHFNSFRKNQLLRIRKYLNEVMLDQLPILADVQRYMDELTILSAPDHSTLASSSLVLETIPVVRESLLKNRSWLKVSEDQYRRIFSKITNQDSDVKIFADIYGMDGVDELMGELPVTDTPNGEPLSVIIKVVQPAIHPGQKNVGFIYSRSEYKFDTKTESQKLVNTPKGAYRRFTTVPNEATNSSNELTERIIPHAAAIEATVVYDDGRKKMVYTNSVSLPFQELKLTPCITKQLAEATIDTDLPHKLWRQAGSLDSTEAVVQMQFVKQSHVRVNSVLCEDIMSSESLYVDCYCLQLVHLSVP